jgi:hypothetical protein
MGEERRVSGGRQIDQGESPVEVALNQDQQIMVGSGTEYSEFFGVS